MMHGPEKSAPGIVCAGQRVNHGGPASTHGERVLALHPARDDWQDVPI